jgi:hypothetical protein
MASAPSRRPRIDPIDEPPRPLGAKRAELVLRRGPPSVSPSACKRASPNPAELVLASRDHSVVFTLNTTAQGLLIERTQNQPMGTRLVQVMMFADRCTFERWCECEPIRFGDALLFTKLRREGHARLTDRT